MAQYRTDKNEYLPNGTTVFETQMLATKDGLVVGSGNPLPVDIGDGEITLTGDVNIPGNVEITNDVGNPIPVSGTVDVNTSLDSTVFTNFKGRDVVRVDDDTVQHTSTNRRKVSEQEIIFFNTFQYDKDDQIWDEDTVGNGVATFNEFQGGVDLTVSDVGDVVKRVTRNVIPYIPGRQNEVTLGVKFTEPTLGVRRRIGMYNDENGFFFEDNGGTYAVVLRRNTSGGVVETRVIRDNWNIDKLDGTGPSGITADPSAMQLVDIEYEWYGTGIVEFKWIIDNNAVSVHRFDTANEEPNTWANTPFLPLCVEIENVSAASGTYTMYQGSASVSAEGLTTRLGREENATTPIGGVNLASADTFLPVISIRLRPDRLNGVAIPLEFFAAATTNDDIYYRIYRNATLTGASWSNVGTDSFVQVDTSATALTDGNAIQTGYLPASFFTSGTGSVVKFPPESIQQLGRNNMGTEPQIFTITAASPDAGTDVFASLSWTEIR